MIDTNPPSVLAFEGRFPVSETKSETPFSDDQIHDLNQSAADVLSALISLDQMSYEPVDPDKKSTSSEVRKLEQKVDFITELLVKVIQSQQSLPFKKVIKMSAERVVWSPEVSLSPGDFCLLSIHLSPKYPTPLELPVEVINTHPQDSIDMMIEAKTLLTDEKVIDDLTRLVFLYHRRQIALKRTQS